MYIYRKVLVQYYNKHVTLKAAPEAVYYVQLFTNPIGFLFEISYFPSNLEEYFPYIMYIVVFNISI